jgi:ACR3 family arsenite efflux pump ArsB
MLGILTKNNKIQKRKKDAVSEKINPNFQTFLILYLIFVLLIFIPK